MSTLDDPRVLFAAERTLLAWVRTRITKKGAWPSEDVVIGIFMISRFGSVLFVSVQDTVKSVRLWYAS